MLRILVSSCRRIFKFSIYRADSSFALLTQDTDRNTLNNSYMMTSSNGNIFCVTGPMCAEFTGNRWIPLTKASDAGL